VSHVASVDIEVKDLDALDEAAKQLGLELVRDQKSYRWFGQHVGDFPLPEGFKAEDLGQCDHAIRIPGGMAPGGQAPYEIGVVRRRDGRPGYTLMWDFWCGGYGLQAKVGDGCQKLVCAYASAVTKKTMIKQGYRIAQEIHQESGAVKYVFAK
jgi:hypothetical protein